MRRAVPVVAGLCLALSTGLDADDWLQWRGPDRSAEWRETGILERFPDDGLTVTWRVPVNGGFAGPVVADGRVFVLDYREDDGSRTMDGRERVLALDEETGEVLWTHDWPTTYRNIIGKYATGPRATPAVDGDRLYVVGAGGMILCLDTATGDVVWEIDTLTAYGTTVPVYGVSSSPLVDGDHLITVTGGEPDALIVAFDKRTGVEIWRSLPLNTEMGYGQPMIYEAGGVRQLIVWHPRALSSLDPATGEVYWEEEWVSNMPVVTPVKSGSYLLVTQFFRGATMLRLNPDRPDAEILWRGRSRSELPDQTDGLHSLITTPIIDGDYIYGVGSYGELRALDARTGERVWESRQMVAQERWSAAFMVRHGDRFFVANDTGELIIARFTPEGYVEIDRTRLIEPTLRTRGGATGRWGDRPVVWSHPAYANRHIVARNDREIIRASLAADE